MPSRMISHVVFAGLAALAAAQQSTPGAEEKPVVITLNDQGVPWKTAVVITPSSSQPVEQGVGECLKTAFMGDVVHNGGKAHPEKPVAEFSFQPPKDGCYEIEEYHPAAGCTVAGGAQATPGLAPVRIDYCKGRTAQGVIDQAKHGGQWNRITKLPFYVGHEGKISITRQDFPAELCPKGDCFYMVDGFRLTWVGEHCHYQPDPRAALEAEAMEEAAWRAQQQTEKGKQAREEAQHFLPQDEKQLLEAAAAEAAVREAQKPAGGMAVQVVVDDFMALVPEPPSFVHQPSELVDFAFEAPLDGCYMVEERHPHRPEELKAVPYTLNYCKGRSAEAAVAHTDGRHEQWNYVAHLPYYDDVKTAGVLVPRRLAQAGRHAFRYTFVGPKCHSQDTAVHGLTLRMTADFAAVRDRLPAYKAALSQTLAQAAGVLAERVRVDHVRKGSVIAEVHILPPSVHASGMIPVRSSDSATAVANIATALGEKAGALGKDLCALVDDAQAAAGRCTTQVLAKGRLMPLMDRSPVVQETTVPAEAKSEGDGNMTLLLVLAVVLPAKLLAVAAAIAYRKKQALKQAKMMAKEAAGKEKQPDDVEAAVGMPVAGEDEADSWENVPTVVVASMKKPATAEAPEAMVDDSASTASPKDDDTRSESSVPSETAA